ncbi:MAG: hypothetical protein FWB85_03930 [Chitinispirillia bacterium]|nr:hypothetical protein [Chitinispirillia bacterium]MCL2241502.1 hypothetical protein [Chitinispirillia bacterium]
MRTVTILLLMVLLCGCNKKDTGQGNDGAIPPRSVEDNGSAVAPAGGSLNAYSSDESEDEDNGEILAKEIAKAWTAAQIVEKAVVTLKRFYHRDREILDINRLVSAYWHQSGGYACITSPKEDDGTNMLDIVLSFVEPPYYVYMRGGRKFYITETFMNQINKKRSNNIPLKNFIRKDLIITFEFADGDKVVFREYYDDIRRNLPFWREELDPENPDPLYK